MPEPLENAPRLLDLFCCSGIGALGYHRAGFEVIGVDIAPQPRYPFRFVQLDAIEALDRLVAGGTFDWIGPGILSAIHASPPCQHASDLQKQNKRDYPALIEPVRERLEALAAEWGIRYVIENVEGADLRDPTVLCGTMFPGLRVLRHRLFESNFPVEQPAHPKHPLVFTHDKRKAHYGRLDQDLSFVQVTGGGNCTIANARAAMGLPATDRRSKFELNEGIPAAYTEHIGTELMAHIEEARCAA